MIYDIEVAGPMGFQVSVVCGQQASRWLVADFGSLESAEAFILFDTAGRAPLGVVHWFACGLPPTKMGFKEGEAAQPPSGYMGGKSTMGLPTYFGPCPPKGVKAHPYVFTLMAYDIAPDTIKEGLPPDEFVKEVQAAGGKLLQSVSLVSRYGH
jgi:phosphatidylethanolamine-binding protein (PEBP) family uncharacterized protein